MTSVASSSPQADSGVDTQNPWPGLVAFSEQLQKYFHGRADEADELLRRVERRDLMVLFGQSGLGKSSLLQAGLFPRLRAAGYLPVPIRLDYAATTPALSEQVKSAVNRAVLDAGGRLENAASDSSETLWEHFHRRNLVQQMSDGQPAQLVLVLDQFEELFSIGYANERSRDGATRFMIELEDLIEKRVPDVVERRLEDSPEQVKRFALDDRGYRTLICLREDYLPHLEGIQHTMPSIGENRMRLTRMNGLRALEAVVSPGRGLITADVGRQVVQFVAGGRARDANTAPPMDDELATRELEPSLLSLVCRELNNRRQVLGLPQITADLLAGSRESILQDYYERCMADQLPAVRIFVEDELVTDSGFRENVALERARKTLSLNGASVDAIDELVKRRLLHVEDRLDIKRVELTHDVLTAVVKKSRDLRQQRDAVLRTEQQAQAERDLIRRRRTKQLASVAVAACAVVAVIASGASYYTMQQRDYANQQRDFAVSESQRATKNYVAACDTVRGVITSLAQQLRDREGITVQTVNAALNEVVPLVKNLESQNPNNIDIQRVRASMHFEFAKVYQNLRFLPEAIEHAETGLKIRRQLVDLPTVTRTWLADCADSLDQCGDIRRQMNKSEDAQRLFEEAYAIRKKLQDEEPDNAIWKFGLSQSLVRIGDLKFDAYRDAIRKKSVPGKNLAEAKADYKKALSFILEADRHKPDDLKWQREISWNFNKLGDILLEERNILEARVQYEKGLQARQLVFNREPTNTLYKRDLAYSLENVGKAWCEEQNFVQGQKFLFESLVLRNDLTDQDKQHSLWRYEYAVCLYLIGKSMQGCKNFELAGGFYLLAIEEFKQMTRDNRAQRYLANLPKDYKQVLEQLNGEWKSKKLTPEELQEELKSLARKKIQKERSSSVQGPT